MPSTTYTCTITAATSGGAGPLSERIAATTEGIIKVEVREIPYSCDPYMHSSKKPGSVSAFLPWGYNLWS